jgi:hypothetical protein
MVAWIQPQEHMGYVAEKLVQLNTSVWKIQFYTDSTLSIKTVTELTKHRDILFICGLFYDAATSSDHTASNNKIMKGLWIQKYVTNSKTVSWHLPEGREKNYEKPVRVAGLWAKIWTHNLLNMWQNS